MAANKTAAFLNTGLIIVEKTKTENSCFCKNKNTILRTIRK